MKNIISKTMIVALFAFTVISCNNAPVENKKEKGNEAESEELVILNKNQMEALNLKTGTFSKRNLTSVIKVNGTLTVSPRDKADVGPVIGGNVEKINVFEGDKVTKGQTLVVLRHPDYITLQEEFSVLAGKVDYLEKEYLRQKQLFENNVGAARDYQKAMYEYNTARARYESLRQQLLLLNLSPEKVKRGEITSAVELKAPISGYVSGITVKIGTYAQGGQRLFKIIDSKAVHVDFPVYENDVHSVRKGQKLHFKVSGHDNEEYTATVFAVEKEFMNNARAVIAHASINNGEGAGLIPGMYFSGHLHTDSSYVSCLPDEAIVDEGTKSFIFVVDKEKSRDKKLTAFKPVEVIKGLSDEGYTQVSTLNPLPKDALIALNSAYYLLSDMKKEEAGDDD